MRHNVGPWDVTCQHCKPIMVMGAVFGWAVSEIMRMYSEIEVTGEA